MPRCDAATLRTAKPPRSARAWAQRADDLLATLAFPPSQESWALAASSAAEVGSGIQRLGAARHRLDDHGYDGTDVHHTFDLGVSEWLVATWPGDVEIHWADASAASALESLLAPTLLPGEEDGYDDSSLTMQAWIRRARGDAWTSDLAWVLDALRDTGDSLARRAAAWEQAALPIRWKLKHAGVMHARITPTRAAVRRELRAAPAHPARTFSRSVPVRLLGASEAQRVIHVARETLAARSREVHAISFANPGEVWWGDLGHGTGIAVIGVHAELRLSLEANYGFVLFSNGVPVGYGGVSPLYRQANTGVNIFPAFRGTEAAALWIGALRSFHSLFGTQRFIANPFQVGRGNPEAIASGAFWFYYRLGFRPVDADVRARAEAEAAARAANPRHRSSAATLRALAAVDLVLTLSSANDADAFDERWLARLALRDTAHIAAEGHRGRHAAARRIAERVARTLGADRRHWSAAERAAFEALAPLVEEITDLARWSARDRRALAQVLRTKGAAQERHYVERAARHPRWYPALATLAREATPPVRTKR
jgi:hypothetical protein